VCGPAAELPAELPSVTAAADRDSVLRTSFAAAVAPRPSPHVKPAAAYTKDVRPTEPHLRGGTLSMKFRVLAREPREDMRNGQRRTRQLEISGGASVRALLEAMERERDA